MKHLGDITKIIGSEAPVVDVVIGGSPCQDLSVAGKRAGLAGERSVLYMEQIRIIKEMREADVLRGRADVDIRPRYMVWENVPGAFSTNGGKDFAAVIEEAIRVAEPEAPDIPVPEKGWPTSGCFWDELGGWSVAWRVLDAQFWGVPQRRRRIALVADFGGLSAPEILFVRKSVSGNIEPGKQKRKEAPGDAGESSGGAVVFGIGGYNSGAWMSDNPNSGIYEAETSRTLDSINCGYPGCNQGGMAVVQSICFEPGAASRLGGYCYEDISGTLRAEMGDNQFAVTYQKVTGPLMANSHPGSYTGQDAFSDMLVAGPVEVPRIAHTLKGKANCDFREDSETYIVTGVDCRNFNESQVYPTLQAKSNGGQSLNYSGAIRIQRIVRRLTPLECERLQGFPDGWTDIGEWVDSKGKKHKAADSPRYKALGNSIAIPPWKWVLKRMCACYERDATMASLFDGIGGFPYIWEQLNGKGSCLWASEIDEFPMAVTKRRLGGG